MGSLGKEKESPDGDCGRKEEHISQITLCDKGRLEVKSLFTEQSCLEDSMVENVNVFTATLPPLISMCSTSVWMVAMWGVMSDISNNGRQNKQR